MSPLGKWMCTTEVLRAVGVQLQAEGSVTASDLLDGVLRKGPRAKAIGPCSPPPTKTGIACMWIPCTMLHRHPPQVHRGVFARRAPGALLLDYVPPEEPPSTPLGNALRIR